MNIKISNDILSLKRKIEIIYPIYLEEILKEKYFPTQGVIYYARFPSLFKYDDPKNPELKCYKLGQTMNIKQRIKSYEDTIFYGKVEYLRHSPILPDKILAEKILFSLLQEYKSKQ